VYEGRHFDRRTGVRAWHFRVKVPWLHVRTIDLGRNNRQPQALAASNFISSLSMLAFALRTSKNVA
jgi:hypothetical protein